MNDKSVFSQVYNALKASIVQGSTVVAAVSGGADSMALADCCRILEQEQYCNVYIMHVEHGIRGQEALADAQLVQSFCMEHGLKFSCEHVTALSYAEENKLSLESAARTLRYKALQKFSLKVKASCILTAHHSDDQAETILLKLLRGTSLAGLSGIQKQNGNLVRPFLSLTRSQLEAYCKLQQIDYCHDSSNDDTYYTRNKIRLELLPYLAESFNPNIKSTLVKTAELLQEDEDFINSFVDKEYNNRCSSCDNRVIVQTTDWNRLASAVRTRLLRRCYFAAGGEELGFVHTQAVDKMCLKGVSGKTIRLPQKLQARYAYDRLIFTKDELSASSKQHFCYSFSVQDGLTLDVPNGKIILHILNDKPQLNKRAIMYPLELITGKLTVRYRLPGDVFAPYGRAGQKKLKDYFIDKKIPREVRDNKILLCNEKKILGIFDVANGAWPCGKYTKWLLAEFTERKNENE